MEERELVLGMAAAYVRGVGVDWSAFFAGRGASRVELPTYAFQRQRYWLQEQATGADATSMGLDSAGHPLLGAVVASLDSDGVVLTGRLSVETQPWLADHDVLGRVLLPGTAFVELALRAGDEVGCDRIEELTLRAPLVLPQHGGTRVRVAVAASDESGARTVSVHSRAEDAVDAAWVLHAEGVFAAGSLTSSFDWGEWPPQGAVSVGVEGVYERLLERGYTYGPVFQGLRAAWRRGEELFAEVALSEQARADAGRFGLHPALLDAAVHEALDDGFEGAETVLPSCGAGCPCMRAAPMSCGYGSRSRLRGALPWRSPMVWGGRCCPWSRW
ncbi:polyketide synthase dehydratase domain-containing protein [Allosalinactinospora lopnorensis]|uniref:polyketide synthase dehydratase domain-containing protein n=1 Tax=Allosalinactinospora lopnorensis TaxID=1352348 RepID=UPI00138EE12F|nr:polyketide synthase dehydratase domain-containing protein [Allosalinactinospora lopnorensis]